MIRYLPVHSLVFAALLIAATALILGSVEVWAGGSWAPAAGDAGVFVICNAL